MTEWRQIVGWPYEVSDDGQVRREPTQFVLTPSVLNSGYRKVTLSKNNERRDFTIHRLVCSAFVGPPPEGGMALHKDGDKLNNRAANLYWGDAADNMDDMFRLGEKPVGEALGNAKLTEGGVRRVRDAYEALEGEKPPYGFWQQFCREFNCSDSVVMNAAKRNTWRHVQ